METTCKYISGAVMGIMSLLAPVQGLVVCALVFVGIDFATGVAASYKRSQRLGRPWGFESDKAWDTITKLAFVMGGIVLAWLIDFYILDFMNLRLAKLFTGFVCGIEFWSYLENAAEISQHPVFGKLGRFVKNKIDIGIGVNAEEEDDEQRAEKQ